MAKTDSWHSVLEENKPDGKYHNNTDCNTGNNIEKENRRPGTGGLRLCDECRRLA